MLVAATVRRIEGDNVVVVRPDGQPMRLKADQLLHVPTLAAEIDGKVDAAAGAFTTQPPTSAVAATTATQLVRQGEVQALFDALNAYAVSLAALITANQTNIASNDTDIAALQSGKQDTLDASNKQAVCIAMGVPWVQEHQAEGSDVGASSTAWHEIASVTIPANTLGTNGRAVLELMVEGVANAGQTAGRWKVNGTVVHSRQGGAWDTGSSVRYMIGQGVLVADDSTGAQKGHFFAHLTDEGATDGTGGWMWQDGIGGSRFDDTTEDTRSDVTLSFEMKFATSDASNRFRRMYAQLKIEPTAVVAGA